MNILNNLKSRFNRPGTVDIIVTLFVYMITTNLLAEYAFSREVSSYIQVPLFVLFILISFQMMKLIYLYVTNNIDLFSNHKNKK